MDEEITIQHKKTFKEKISDFFSNPKKRLIFVISAGLVLIGAVGAGLYLMSADKNESSTDNNNQIVAKTNFETKSYSVLDGTEIASSSDDQHPLAVMVENHVDARPQVGLDKASIVYEAIAEGGITRFMAIFGPRSADRVGPVRSARPYYVDWAMGYNAYYAHVGGNANALDQIISDGVLDLDQFKYPSSYWRDTGLNVSREHTMFASVIKLREQAVKLGYSTKNDYRQYKFKDIATSDSQDSEETSIKTDASTSIQNSSTYNTLELEEEASTINVLFSNDSYNVSFEYDKTNNNYKRILNTGNVQTDRDSETEITPTNIIVMTVNRSPLVTRINEHGWLMDTIGQGKAKIFSGGSVINGTWEKDSKSEREVFYDDQGNEIVFNRGQFWICVIPPDSSFTYK